MSIPDIFVTYPTVYAVADRYRIIVPVTAESVMWVKVGERCFYDDSNGILRSSSMTHIMEVPGRMLDEARAYTVCWRVVRERKPYFSDLGEAETFTVPFRPVEGKEIHIYHVADAHNRVTSPIRAASWFGDDLDLLVLNGDVPDHSGDIRNFAAIHRIAGEITHGEIPAVFSRGNHDTRGVCAEKLAEHTPTDCGRSYYTFRVGPVWGVVLDCAEDKPDDHPEYGNTICCHDFRLRETDFLRRVAQDPEHEYAAPGVEHRLVIVHNPFPQTFEPPFDIEQPVFTEWCEILRGSIRPEAILCGHVHACYVTRPGEERDHKGQPCPVICASRPGHGEEFIGGAITLTEKEIRVEFTDQDRNVRGTDVIKL
ncbi:MAG: metallophosphoesterase [Clostridia bacterium]|nr:metallophosphoesterase [Clostridia bacterium]